jgi:hypothetical protein
MNEYMTLELDGERLATFPDLICTFGKDGIPVSSASVGKGDEVYLTVTGRDNIPIGDGNRYSENYEAVERALGKPMISHLEGFLKA